MITLKHTHCRLEIDEQHGGRIAQCYINDTPILVEVCNDPLLWGAYPMAPWVGRLKNGELHVKDRCYRFPLNLAPHAIHGTCFDQPWHVDAHDEHSLRMSHQLSAPWPFPGRVEQIIRLEHKRVHCEMLLHSDAEPFPASMGWHPWFKRKLNSGQALELSFSAEHAYACDDSLIPTGELTTMPPAPWDDCFIGLHHAPVLTWPGFIELTISSTQKHWVVYSKPEHAICVEPQSAPANAINSSNCFIVRPDHPLHIDMSWSWQKHAL